jgi:dihydrofolate synthase/folylpolyglutamate synthase
MTDSYKRIQDYLHSFINYEKIPFFSYQRKLKLQRMHFLLESLGIFPDALSVLHIAGTKGKGSTAFLCSWLLAAKGQNVGLYTSPHLFDFRERIQTVARSQGHKVTSNLISKLELSRIVNEMQPKIAKLRLPKSMGRVSFFEVYTAVAFKHFLDKKVDVAVLETGLGGRLDATNVVSPRLSLITHIGYDHIQALGRRLSDIALEKAGIIKANVPVVCSRQRPSVLRVIKKACRRKQSPLFILDRDFFAENIRLRRNATLFDFHFGDIYFKDIEIRLKGKYQVENAACALAAFILMAGDDGNDGVVKPELYDCILPGRFEIVRKHPLTIIDIAHNISSFCALRDNLKLYFAAKKVILIFACSKDKDAKGMLKAIPFRRLIVTRFGNPRSFLPQELIQTCNLKGAISAQDIQEALRIAAQLYRRDHLILVSGSLFLASEAKKYLQKAGRDKQHKKRGFFDNFR